MKIAARMLMTAVLVLGVAVVASAQPGGAEGRDRGGRGGAGGFGGGFGGGGMSRLALLRIEAVQKELGLTEEQITAIGKLQQGNRGPGGRGGEGRPGGEGRRRGGDRPKADGDEARAAAPSQWYFVQDEQPRRGQISEEDRAKFRKEAEERAAKQKEELAKILKPDQAKRLREIYIQIAGIAALNDSEVVEELKITDEQKEKLAKVREEIGTSMREAFSGGDREGARAKLEELRKSSEEKTLAVLSADQKAKFEEMKGKKFDLPEGARGGGRRPGGDRPAGDRPNQN